MSDTHVQDLLAAYALGSLEKEEMAQVADHLAICQGCRQELRAYQEVVDQLPLAAPMADPPEDLQQKIMARIENQAKPTGADQESSRARPGWLSWRFGPAWGVVGLVLILVLGVSNIFLWRQMQNLGAQHSLEVYTLSGTEAIPQAVGLVILERDGHDGTLVVNDLRPLDDSLQYQLWFLEGEQRTDGGVFSVSETGYGWLYIELPKPLSAYTGFGITIEPAGGSPGPTGPKVLGVDF